MDQMLTTSCASNSHTRSWPKWSRSRTGRAIIHTNRIMATRRACPCSDSSIVDSKKGQQRQQKVRRLPSRAFAASSSTSAAVHTRPSRKNWIIMHHILTWHMMQMTRKRSSQNRSRALEPKEYKPRHPWRYWASIHRTWKTITCKINNKKGMSWRRFSTSHTVAEWSTRRKLNQ